MPLLCWRCLLYLHTTVIVPFVCIHTSAGTSGSARLGLGLVSTQHTPRLQRQRAHRAQPQAEAQTDRSAHPGRVPRGRRRSLPRARLAPARGPSPTYCIDRGYRYRGLIHGHTHTRWLTSPRPTCHPRAGDSVTLTARPRAIASQPPQAPPPPRWSVMNRAAPCSDGPRN